MRKNNITEVSTQEIYESISSDVRGIRKICRSNNSRKMEKEFIDYIKLLYGDIDDLYYKIHHTENNIREECIIDRIIENDLKSITDAAFIIYMYNYTITNKKEYTERCRSISTYDMALKCLDKIFEPTFKRYILTFYN